MTPVTFLLICIVFAAVVGFIVYKKNTKFKNKFDEVQADVEKRVHDITDKI